MGNLMKIVINSLLFGLLAFQVQAASEQPFVIEADPAVETTVDTDATVLGEVETPEKTEDPILTGISKVDMIASSNEILGNVLEQIDNERKEIDLLIDTRKDTDGNPLTVTKEKELLKRKDQLLNMLAGLKEEQETILRSINSKYDQMSQDFLVMGAMINFIADASITLDINTIPGAGVIQKIPGIKLLGNFTPKRAGGGYQYGQGFLIAGTYNDDHGASVKVSSTILYGPKISFILEENEKPVNGGIGVEFRLFFAKSPLASGKLTMSSLNGKYIEGSLVVDAFTRDYGNGNTRTLSGGVGTKINEWSALVTEEDYFQSLSYFRVGTRFAIKQQSSQLTFSQFWLSLPQYE